MHFTIKASVFDDSDDLIDVTGEATLPGRGKRDEYGVQMEPDDPASMELLDAVDSAGNTLNLNAAETQRAIEALWDAVEGPQD